MYSKMGQQSRISWRKWGRVGMRVGEKAGLNVHVGYNIIYACHTKLILLMVNEIE